MVPDEFRKKFNDGTLEKFDIIVSYSSLEHSGLGRYGDGLHPWADLVTMSLLWCVTKDGGDAIIGVPSSKQDYVFFNACRCYGPQFLDQLFANWK